MSCQVYRSIYLNRPFREIQDYSQCYPFTLVGFAYAKYDRPGGIFLALIAALHLLISALVLAVAFRALSAIQPLRAYVPAIYVYSGFFILQMNDLFGWDGYFNYFFNCIISIFLTVICVQSASLFYRPKVYS